MSKAITVRNRRIGQAVRSTLELLETRVLLAAGDLDPSYGYNPNTGATLGYVDQRQWGNAFSGGVNGGLNIDSSWLYDNVKSLYYDWMDRLDFSRGSTAIHNVIVDSGGKVVTVGSELGRHLAVGDAEYGIIDPSSGKGTKTKNFEVFDTDFAINRYDYDGILDYTLRGGEGPLPAAPGDRDWASNQGTHPASQLGTLYDHGIGVAVDTTGGAADPRYNSIIMVGTNDLSSNTTRKIVLARYEPSGQFATQLMTMAVGGMNWTLSSVALQADGKIVVGGSVGVRGSTTGEDWALWRFNRDFTLDTTFGTGGQVLTPFISYSTDVLMDLKVEPDQIMNISGALVANPNAGKILAIGYEDDALWQSRGVSKMVLARYMPDGTLDASYGAGGKLIIDDFGGRDAMGASLVIQPDGKAVVLGVYDSTPGLGTMVASGMAEPGSGVYLYRGFDTTVALRLNADGTVDQTSFGARGREVIADPNAAIVGQRVTLDSAGKVIIAGYRQAGATTNIFVSRMTVDGRMDQTWGVGGTRVVTTLGNNVSTNWFNRASVAVEGDNKIIVTGNRDITYTVTGPVNYFDGVTAQYSFDPISGTLTYLYNIGTQGAIARLLSDNTPPQAELLTKDVVLETPGTATIDFRVAFVDDTFLKLSSIDSSAVSVFAPDGTPLTVTMVGAPLPEGPNNGTDYSQATVVFRVTVPSDYWNSSDHNGAYRIELNAGKVRDLDGTYAAARTLGQFSVNIRPLDITPPVANLVNLPFDTTGNNAITIGGKQNLNFTIRYTDVGGNRVTASDIDNLDIRVVRQGYYDMPAKMIKVDSAANAGSILVEYQIDAPGGYWDVTDNGTYSINLQDHQISDDFYVPNWSIAGLVAEFNVAVDPQKDVRPTSTLISVPTIDAVSDTPAQFVVQYSQSQYSPLFKLDLSTIAANNSAIRVTAAGVGYNVLANYVRVEESGTDAVTGTEYYKVVYEVTASDGTWDRLDNGTYTISVEPNQVADKDFPANFVLPAILGTFNVGITDIVPPTADVTLAPAIVQAGTSAYSFQVTYSDNVAVRFRTLGTGDIQVTGPNGYTTYPTLTDVSVASDGTPRIATYSIATPPGGSWDRTGDNGTYIIHLVAGEVTDTANLSAVPLNPSASPADKIGEFVVNIGPDVLPPTAVLQSAPPVGTKGGTSYGLTIVWSDNVMVDASTIGDGNIVVVAPDGTQIPATFVTPSTPLANGTSISASYRIVPPGGTWNGWDNGTYQIKVLAGQVKDTNGNAVAAGTLGSFTVAITVPPITATLMGVQTAAGGDPEMYVTVKFVSSDPITSSTLTQDGLIALTKAGGAPLSATFATFTTGGNDEASQTVRFRISGPGGRWDYRDTGAYVISVKSPNVVRTSENGTLAGSNLGTANVNINSVMLVGSELVISGTDANDSIDIITEGSDIRTIVNGQETLTSGMVISTIRVMALNGDDLITVGPDVQSVVVHGGEGNDTIDGGDSPDVLYGDDGNDVIYGRGGSDAINGGLGDDVMYVDSSDVVDGGGGLDTITGGDDGGDPTTSIGSRPVSVLVAGDEVFFTLTGGGAGSLDGNGVLTLMGTTSNSVLTISVRKGEDGDGVYDLSGIICSGPMKRITAKAVILRGDIDLSGSATSGSMSIQFQRVQDASINLGSMTLGALTLMEWTDTPGSTDDVLQAATVGTVRITGRRENTRTADVEYLAGDFEANVSTGMVKSVTVAGAMRSAIAVTGSIGTISAGSISDTSIRAGVSPTGASIGRLSVGHDTNSMDLRVDGSIGVVSMKGGLVNSRIQARSGIRTMTVASLLDSEILVGVDRSFNEDVISRAAVSNSAARLGTLTVTGLRLPAGQSHPAYVVNSNISAPTVGFVSLLNVPADSGTVVHVMNDTGVLKVRQTALVDEPMFERGTWNTGSHPLLWDVI